MLEVSSCTGRQSSRPALILSPKKHLAHIFQSHSAPRTKSQPSLPSTSSLFYWDELDATALLLAFPRKGLVVLKKSSLNSVGQQGSPAPHLRCSQFSAHSNIENGNDHHSPAERMPNRLVKRRHQPLS
jgi:hypothetical protein